MTRAMVCFDRMPDGSWKAVTARDAQREAQVGRILSTDQPPRLNGYTTIVFSGTTSLVQLL